MIHVFAELIVVFIVVCCRMRLSTFLRYTALQASGQNEIKEYLLLDEIVHFVLGVS